VNDAAMRGNIWPEVLGRAWESSFLKTLVLAHHQQRMLRSGRLDVVRKWIAVSEFMRRKFVEAGLPEEKVVALRHCWNPGIDPDALREGSHYLFLGRLVPEKGTNVLLDAWRILEKRMGKACPRLVIAGSGIEEAKMHAASNHLRKVVCVGFVAGEQKEHLLSTCRALIAPSIWWEPLGLIVYEAYDAAKPVLAAASGGLTETVVEGVTGFLHEPGSAEQLADDVERLEMAGDGRRNEMGRAGRKWLLANASPNQWRDDFVSIIRSLT
jgi:glycosyltransferase involved in cell wall biosynthesis